MRQKTKNKIHTNVPVKYYTTIINSSGWRAAGTLESYITGGSYWVSAKVWCLWGPCRPVVWLPSVFWFDLFSYFDLLLGNWSVKPWKWHLHFAAFESQVQCAPLSLSQSFKDVWERAIPVRLMVCGWTPALLANWRWSVKNQSNSISRINHQRWTPGNVWKQ